MRTKKALKQLHLVLAVVGGFASSVMIGAVLGHGIVYIQKLQRIHSKHPGVGIDKAVLAEDPAAPDDK
jgi:hypothetical protein